jgi:hypothetical protein
MGLLQPRLSLLDVSLEPEFFERLEQDRLRWEELRNDPTATALAVDRARRQYLSGLSVLCKPMSAEVLDEHARRWA